MIHFFAYGYGLTYDDSINVAQLDTVNDHKIEIDVDAPYPLLVGKVSNPWLMMLQNDEVKEFPGASRASIGTIAMMEADKLVQGDAREFRWNGDGMGLVGFSSTWFKANLTAYVLSGGVLKFDVRTIEKPSGSMVLTMGCAKGYCGEIELNQYLPDVESKEWRTISVDLMCFAKEGVEFERSSIPFALTTDSSAALRVANIEYQAKTTDATIRCTQ